MAPPEMNHDPKTVPAAIAGCSAPAQRSMKMAARPHLIRSLILRCIRTLKVSIWYAIYQVNIVCYILQMSDAGNDQWFRADTFQSRKDSMAALSSCEGSALRFGARAAIFPTSSWPAPYTESCRPDIAWEQNSRRGSLSSKACIGNCKQDQTSRTLLALQ